MFPSEQGPLVCARPGIICQTWPGDERHGPFVIKCGRGGITEHESFLALIQHLYIIHSVNLYFTLDHKMGF